MILNTFKREDVLRVFDYLMTTNKSIIFAVNLSDFTREEAEKVEYLQLVYVSMFHRLELRTLNLNEPLFSNPNCSTQISSEKQFIEGCVASPNFNEMIK